LLQLTLAYALNRPQAGCAEVAEVLRDLDLAPCVPPSALVFSQVSASFRSAWIAAAVMLMAAGALILRQWNML
jgi:hypothetical protein